MSFFDKFSDKVNEFAGKSGEVFQLSKLKTKVSSLEREKDKALIELGRKAYYLHLSGQLDHKDVAALVGSVADLEKEIRDLEAAIEKVRNEIRGENG